MKKNESIKNVMSTDLRTITTQTKLSECRAKFIELKIHHLPVTEGNKIIGLLSYNDLLRIDSGELYQQDSKQADALIDNLASVSSVMTKDLRTINVKDTVRDATIALAKGGFHSLPVVDNENTLVGIVTSTDLLCYYRDSY